ncbi:TolC family protein [Streptobacillus felis]|uniref:TolC family protein n=1 Tax=Streptobacillus felis TaxID=1384509 RepID=A0A7Z0PFB7_9FUSO|nr:TolC family protein [Streptobacillus felis]NYV28167.1 TolC family protein [Streptobacillus felis]
MKKFILLLSLFTYVYSSELSEFEKEHIQTNIAEELNVAKKNKTKKLLGSLYMPKITPSFDTGYTLSLNDQNEYTHNYNVNTSLNVEYGPLTYNIGVDLKDKEISSHSIGLSATINNYTYDFINESNIDYEIEKHNIHSKNKEKVESILNLYSRYILKKYELDIINEELNKLSSDEVVIKKQYERGLISKNEYISFKDNLEIAKLNLEISKDEFDILKLEIKENKIDITKLPEFKFKFLDREEINKNVISHNNIKDLEISKKEIEYQKYISTNVIPTVTVSSNYDILNKNFGINLNISKLIDFSENEINVLNEKKKEINELKEDSKIYLEKNLLLKNNEYARLKLSYKQAIKSLENYKRELQTMEVKYRQGNESYLKLVEKRKDIKNLKLNLKKIEIDLSIFEWKIKGE